MTKENWAANALAHLKQELLSKYKCVISDMVEIDLDAHDQDKATFHLIAETVKEAALKLGVTEEELERKRLEGVAWGAKLTAHHIERRLTESAAN